MRSLPLGLSAAALFLCFFSTYRYGRVYMTSAPETFFLFAPLAILLLRGEEGLPRGGLQPLLLGLMVVISAYAIRFEKGLVHFIACFFVLLAEALWSSKFLSPQNLMPALAIYGGFGLFYLGVPVFRRGFSACAKAVEWCLVRLPLGNH